MKKIRHQGRDVHIAESREELVAHLKSVNHILFTAEDPTGIAEIGRTNIEAGPDRRAYCLLHFAAASPERFSSWDSDSRRLRGNHGDVLVDPGLYQKLNREVNDRDSEIRLLSGIEESKTFISFDISDFSTYPPGQQLLIITSVIRLVTGEETREGYSFGQADYSDMEAMLCIGDGYIFVFNDPVSAVWFASKLGSNIQERNARKELPVEYHFRMGIHYGPVYRFWEPDDRKFNYIGSGINGSARVLQVIEKSIDDVVFLSSRVYEQILRLKSPQSPDPIPAILRNLENRGRRKDKHGDIYRVFEIQYMSIC